MLVYKVGDSVIHWNYGSGKIAAVEDKVLPGNPAATRLKAAI